MPCEPLTRERRGAGRAAAHENGAAEARAAGSGPAAPALAPDREAPPGDRLAMLVLEQLALLGERPGRAGLRRTPERVARALEWLTHGYRLDAAAVVGNAIFAEAHRDVVMVRGLEFYSLCEHHMLPFFGRVHIAYVPDGRVIGLSKLPRLVDVFARRLQVQERLTDQVADAVHDVLAPRGVGVMIEAQHLCMMMRGVQRQRGQTVTSAWRGVLRDEPARRSEFMAMLRAAEPER